MAVAVTFVVVYTTLYREGGPKFQRAARQRADELSRAHPGATVVCCAVESKRAFVDVVRTVAERGDTIRELHFIGHGGMYGPMFRTTAMPEQFSPHEWRTLAIPFAEGASAYFHACRSGRFFARFFAQTFGVVAYGYFHYTTLSRRPDRFVWDSPLHGGEGPLFVVAMPGKKSHGLLGSLAKYSHLYPVEKMLRFEPSPPPDASYDGVAELYDETFRDIGVRGPEVAWVDAHVPRGRPAVLELGCGNGALLARLAPRIERGLGVDASPRMVELARRRFGALPNIAFASIDGPRLPAADASVDVVVSLLSWRYLDWDPMIAEVRRVLARAGDSWWSTWSSCRRSSASCRGWRAPRRASSTGTRARRASARR